MGVEMSEARESAADLPPRLVRSKPYFGQPKPVRSKIVQCSITGHSKSHYETSRPKTSQSLSGRHPNLGRQPKAESEGNKPVNGHVVPCNITGHSHPHYDAHILKNSGSLTGRNRLTDRSAIAPPPVPTRSKLVQCHVTGNSFRRIYSKNSPRKTGSLTNRSMNQNRSVSNTEPEIDIIKHSYRQNDVREIFNEIEGIVKNQRENLKSYQINSSPRYTEKIMRK